MIKYVPLLIGFCAVAEITVASGSKEGLYHTLATQFCREQNEPCTVIETSGSRENIELLNRKLVNYAIIQDNLGLENMVVVKKFDIQERFNIFYKGNAGSFQDISRKLYTVDKRSGTYALIYAIHTALELPIRQQENLSILDKQSQSPSFCNRDTEVSFYNISVDSLPYKKMQIEGFQCGIKEYQFTKEEVCNLQQKLPSIQIENGYILNGVVLVRKA